MPGGVPPDGDEASGPRPKPSVPSFSGHLFPGLFPSCFPGSRSSGVAHEDTFGGAPEDLGDGGGPRGPGAAGSVLAGSSRGRATALPSNPPGSWRRLGNPAGDRGAMAPT